MVSLVVYTQNLILFMLYSCLQGIGGAWYPPAQGALGLGRHTRHSYLVPISGYIAVTMHAV